MTDTIFVCQHCGKTSKMEGFRIIEDDSQETSSDSSKNAIVELEEPSPDTKSNIDDVLRPEIDKDYDINNIKEVIVTCKTYSNNNKRRLIDPKELIGKFALDKQGDKE